MSIIFLKAMRNEIRPISVQNDRRIAVKTTAENS